MRIKQTVAVSFVIAAGLLGHTEKACADPVSITAGAASATAGSDTVTLMENGFSVTSMPAAFILQTGIFHVNDIGLDQTFLFTLSRRITVGTVEHVVSQTGLIFIRPRNHMFDLFGGPPQFFELSSQTLVLTLVDSFGSAQNSGDFPFSVSAAITPTPEPSTLTLVGIVIAGLCARRWRTANV